jgi:hypothetical protein
MRSTGLTLYQYPPGAMQVSAAQCLVWRSDALWGRACLALVCPPFFPQ